MPYRFAKFSKYKHKTSKWITYGIIISIQYRENLYKKIKMTDPNSEQFSVQKINISTYNYILKKKYTDYKKIYIMKHYLENTKMA